MFGRIGINRYWESRYLDELPDEVEVWLSLLANFAFVFVRHLVSSKGNVDFFHEKH